MRFGKSTVAAPPAPIPVQAIAVTVQPATAVSVRVVDVPGAASIRAEPATVALAVEAIVSAVYPFEPVNEKLTPPAPSAARVFCARSVVVALVNVHRITLPGAVAAALNVIVPVARSAVADPAPMPVQVAAVSVYPVGIVSVNTVEVEAAPSVTTAPATPVPDVTVVTVWAAPNPLVPLKVKGPTPPLLILVICTVGSLILVKLQTMSLRDAVAAASSVSTAPARVAVPPDAMPVQVAVSAYPAGTVSVMVVAVETAVSVRVTPAIVAPEVRVVRVWAPKPLLALKANAPTAPTLVLVRVSVETVPNVRSSMLIIWRAGSVAPVMSAAICCTETLLTGPAKHTRRSPEVSPVVDPFVEALPVPAL